jgi:hypothetical protein
MRELGQACAHEIQLHTLGRQLNKDGNGRPAAGGAQTLNSAAFRHRVLESVCEIWNGFFSEQTDIPDCIRAGRIAIHIPYLREHREYRGIARLRQRDYRSLLCTLIHPPVSRLAIVMLFALCWSSLAFCGEIHIAAEAGDMAKVKALLKEHPDLVSGKDSMSVTPLHCAAVSGRKDVAELLLANKANVNARDSLGWTPLNWAVRGHAGVVQLLLANNADVNSRDSGDWTHLHWAAVEGHKDVMELLLSHGAEVNAKGKDGKTPLRGAAVQGRKDMVEWLRQHGGHE